MNTIQRTALYSKNRFCRTSSRLKTQSCCHSSRSAIVVGCYKDEDSTHILTQNGDIVNNTINGRILELLKLSNFKADLGKTRTFFDVYKDYKCITVTGLGEQDIKVDPNEERYEKDENIRIATGAAAKSLKSYDMNKIFIDSCGSSSAAAAGACLSVHKFDQYKSKKDDQIELALLNLSSNEAEIVDFNAGLTVAECQNFARDLMETPSNHKYPSLFADIITQKFSKYSDVDLIVRNELWAKEKKMDCFLSVGKGSVHEPLFLELRYKGSDDAPIALVGKGITFDSGGISIKPSSGMGLMRGDMGGAACVLAALEAAVRLQLPVNLVVLVPLAENMPSGAAMNPGDVFTAMNGKTVEVDNTDAEGRLILADALCYANEFKPSHIINLATLTGAIDVALGAGASGVFTTCNKLWSHLQKAGMSTGDRMWRMPLFNYYTEQMKCSKTADLRNTQKKARSAGSPTAAAFLREFVEIDSWAHLDIAGVMTNEGDIPYIGSGMSGRPTRTLIETIRRLSS